MGRITSKRGLTNLVDQVSERGILTDGHDKTLDRSHDRRERQDTSGLVLFSGPVRVFEQRVEDSSETERWLDDIGDELSDYIPVRLIPRGEEGDTDHVR